ncbi:MAG: hypothetical protein JW793_11795 [Acidobacteria bacterium]|nr:hypothetical protein [Acidobacteriota bacterium]
MNMKNQKGIALISTLLILVLLGALLEGFIVSVNSDQGLIGIDREQNRAFYGALGGLEQLTSDLGTLFEKNYAPSTTQINALTQNPPTIKDLQFISPDGSSGYRVDFPISGGMPDQEQRTIPSGPYEGLVGLITPYAISTTVRTPSGSEVRMRRSLQTVAVPVFQFGIFSETDLSFHAGPNFNFGGRVHTNGNLFLSQGNGSTLTMKDRVTALGEVVRTHLVNGNLCEDGTVKVAQAPNVYRNLTKSEGSLVNTLGSALNDPTWTNLSIGTYNGNIRNGRTGARDMELPLVSMGAEPIDIIRRPEPGEAAAKPEILKQRFYAREDTSLRIVLSDDPADIHNLPTVTGGAPVQLTGNAPDAASTPYAVADTSHDGDFKSADGTDLIGGYIKIEMQDQSHNWSDVTNEILSLGIAGRNLAGSNCGNDQPDAVIRLQRLKDNPDAACGGSARQFWPNVLYDTREGTFRDSGALSGIYNVYLGGVMHYVELDVANLARWFRGTIGASGSNAIHTTGYVVYFSDRRTNQDAAGDETGEYGFEDIVNPNDAANGLPNGGMDDGEDINSNGVFDTYGATPILPTGAGAPLDASARPWTAVSGNIARKNLPVLFRRALKLVNGSVIDLGANAEGINYGLAVVSENPVYVQGDYNVLGGDYDAYHVAASVIGDAVTFLSNSWNDKNSFNRPHELGNSVTNPGRIAQTSWYRMAVISGKGKPFPNITGTDYDFGTDGGVHNFLRYLENWGGRTLNYRGSIVSLYFNRQAVGTYKCCTNVYSPPGRGYNFDVEFLQPELLPPATPMFRDVNITGFTQMRLPHQ